MAFCRCKRTVLVHQMPLTCLSCSNYRTTGCTNALQGWPTKTLADCWAAQYEPGSDEAEDWDQNDEPTNP